MSRLINQSKHDPLNTFLRMDTSEQILNETLKDKSESIDDVKKREMTMASLMEQIEFMKSQIQQGKTDSISPPPPPRPISKDKVILLAERGLRNKEIVELKKHFILRMFNPNWLGFPMSIVGTYEFLIIPLDVKKGRRFYESVMGELINDDNVKIIYLTSKIRQDHTAAVKNIYHPDYVRKRLPKKVESQGMYRFLLLIDSVQKITHSCWPIFKKYVK